MKANDYPHLFYLACIIINLSKNVCVFKYSIGIQGQALDERFGHICSDLSSSLSQSVPHASQNWGSTKAVYRFWDNSKVTPALIEASHRIGIERRLWKSDPEISPSIHEYCVILGQITGFVPSKRQPIPGIKIITRSLDMLKTLVDAYSVFQNTG